MRSNAIMHSCSRKSGQFIRIWLDEVKLGSSGLSSVSSTIVSRSLTGKYEHICVKASKSGIPPKGEEVKDLAVGPVATAYKKLYIYNYNYIDIFNSYNYFSIAE
jgi:hypothetical protein